ncbi:hypothetical protein MNB_SV-8-74 [hydrothermal vent metagenome]|uniref:Uncharacterized protein n=1 Tax=hydrothermal vent metagenome TaxID=652676 RepID=A0A1W1C2I6_9ZZZZ
MEYTIILVLVFILAVILLYLYNNNRKLAEQIKILKEVLAIKDTTISNLEASRVSVKDVIENLSSQEEVMGLVEAGESRESISEKLGIPLNKIELIIKFDKIKKEQTSAS